jgi:hypothetical protein
MTKALVLLAIAAVCVSAKRDTSKIQQLKGKVLSETNTFSYDGFKNQPVGLMSIKVDVGHPQTVTLTKEMQQPKWQTVTTASPLKVQGYNQWMSVNGGMVFKNEKSEMVECAMSGTRPLEGKKVVLDYKCKPMSKARFAQAKVTYWHSAHANGEDPPSGWDTRWGSFDYPFYTVSSQGILGCKNTSGGYCTPQHADLFPFESCYENAAEYAAKGGEGKGNDCTDKKAEKQRQLDQLEKEVEAEEREEMQETTEFFGKGNANSPEVQGMHMSDEIMKSRKF